MSMLTPLRGTEGNLHKLSSAAKRVLVLAGLLLAAMVVFRAPAFAQEGTILGTVTDPSGAAVPNATVTILNTSTGAVRKATTNGVGYYIAPDLPIGNYTVGAQAKGFKLTQHTGVVLTVATSLTENFSLQLGMAKQTVTVEAAPVAVQKSSGAVSTLTTGRMISKLATNGHTFYQLLALVPGAASMMSSYQLAVPTGGANAAVSINGQRQAHNIFLIDGGEADDRGGAGNSSVLPSQEAIAEFRTETSNYSPQYGLSSAGTFTMAIKSGTNQFHGEAWEFFRNNWLDAVQYPNIRKNPELRQNIFGFNIGGPVALHQSGHHNTFFFYNMEWRRYIQGGAINTTVPNPSDYTGAFPASMTPAELHTPCVGTVDSTIASEYATDGLALSNCASGAYVPFTNNTIPSNLLSPTAQSLLKTGIFPTSGLTVNAPTPWNSQYLAGAPVPTKVQEEIVRIDHTFNDKFSMFGHFIAEANNVNQATTMWSGDNVPTIGNTFANPSYSAVVHTTYAISPTLLNETAFNFNGNRIHILPLGVFAQPSGYPSYRVFTGPNVDNRIPAINLSGTTGTNYTSNWTPWNNTANDYQLRDDISWIKGNHQIKFGGSWALYAKVQDLFADTEGQYGFSGHFTGSDIADLLLGYANSYSEDAIKDSGHWNNVSWASYVEDNWHTSRRLTLNLGLRWDGIPHTYEANNRFSNFYPNTWNPACTGANFFATGNNSIINSSGPGAGCFGSSPNTILSSAGYKFYLNGVGISGQPGVPHGMVNNAWWNFGPRLGFAYDLTGTGKTIVRGGFGAMYERIQGNDMYNGGTNVPFSANYSTSYVSLDNATQNIQTGAVFSPASAPVLVASLGRALLNNAYAPPVSYQYSLGVERQLNPKLVLSVEYVGTQDRHQDFQAEYNLPPQSDLAGLQTGTLSWNSVVPYQGFHAIPMVQNEANGHYNSLQVYLHGQATKDLSVTAAYTFSKSIDAVTAGSSAGDLGTLYNPYNWSYALGPSAFDRRSAFVSSFVYNLPFLRNSDNKALKTGLGGWELSGIVTAETGTPINITETGDAQNNGVLTGANNLPNFSGSASYPKTRGQWFGTSGFSNPAAGTWGTFPFDSIYGPGYDDWDLTLFKEFPINQERGSHLEFRFETYNAFNHVNPSAVGGGFGSSTFGQVTGFSTMRTIELGARLFF